MQWEDENNYKKFKKMKIKEFKQHHYLNTMIVEFETDDMSALNVYPAGHYIDKGLCKVMEQKDEELGNIFIINESDDYLLFTDMDILVGAKQNRIVNVSTLVKPHSKSNLEVSCIEQNRWDNSFHDFKNSEQSIDPDFRRNKLNFIASKTETEEYRNDLQSGLWSEIRERIEVKSENNPTSDYSSSLRTEKEKRSKGKIPTMQADVNCNGIAIFIDGKLVNVEIFANTALYQYYFEKITEHYLHTAHSGTSKDLSREEIRNLVNKEIGMCLFFNTVSGKNGMGELRFMDGEVRKGFELSFIGEKIHEVVFLDWTMDDRRWTMDHRR